MAKGDILGRRKPKPISGRKRPIIGRAPAFGGRPSSRPLRRGVSSTQPVGKRRLG